jgi:hypothetical protein
VSDTADEKLKALEAEDMKFVLTGGQASKCATTCLACTARSLAILRTYLAILKPNKFPFLTLSKIGDCIP